MQREWSVDKTYKLLVLINSLFYNDNKFDNKTDEICSNAKVRVPC